MKKKRKPKRSDQLIAIANEVVKFLNNRDLSTAEALMVIAFAGQQVNNSVLELHLKKWILNP